MAKANLLIAAISLDVLSFCQAKKNPVDSLPPLAYSPKKLNLLLVLKGELEAELFCPA